jgi:hypothetical protein
MPGNYSLSTQWNINTEFVDVIGLGSSPKNPKVIITSSATTGINVTANDVRIIGLQVSAGSFPIEIATNKPLQYFQNCTANGTGFGRATISGQIYNGTFVNCVATNGFGYSTNGSRPTAAGTFIKCNATNGFAGSAGAFNSGGFSIASGTFIDCTASVFARDDFTGVAKNCVAGADSFGPRVNTGQIIKCKKTSGAFPTLTGSGFIRFSLDGSNNIVNLG